MIFFTADLHFGHENIIKQCRRPFKNIEQMDKALIQNWNSVVKEEDEVYILGDFTMKSAYAAQQYFSALNGKKYLVRGNHDEFAEDYDMGLYGLEWIKDYYKLEEREVELVLFHYPVLEWENKGKNSIHLFGHIHNNKKMMEAVKNLGGKAMNVGVDVNDYTPVSIGKVLEVFKGREHV